jgi:ribosome maturation factor RimP
VLLDSPDDVRRVGIEDCQVVSQQLGDALEAHEAVSGRYMLEVSSPGVNKPLKRPEHFRRVVGQKVRVRTKAPKRTDGAAEWAPERRTWIGRLEGADETAITVTVEGGEAVQVAFDDIEKANLEFEFEQTPVRRPSPKRAKGRAGK